MKIVLFGKNGQLGREFRRILLGLGEVAAFDQDDFNLSDLHTLESILRETQPGLIVNASAYTAVDQAEKESELAMTINAQAPGIMAEQARKLNAAFVHYSTDYVFDGQADTPYVENHPTNPLNMYGQSKRQGEQNVEQAGGAYLILRTSWVYSMSPNSFVGKVLEWSRKNETLKIVSDQVSNPTWARALAQTTYDALANVKGDLLTGIRERRGIYHLAGTGHASRFEWAQEILANDPHPETKVTKLVLPVSSAEFPTPALRPLFSALDCSKFTRAFNISMPAWKESLRAAMRE